MNKCSDCKSLQNPTFHRLSACDFPQREEYIAYCTTCFRYTPLFKSEEEARRCWEEDNWNCDEECWRCGESVPFTVDILTTGAPSWYGTEWGVQIWYCWKCRNLGRDLLCLLPATKPPFNVLREAVLVGHPKTTVEAAEVMIDAAADYIAELEDWIDSTRRWIPVIDGHYRTGCPKCGSLECGLDTDPWDLPAQLQSVSCKACGYSASADEPDDALLSFYTQAKEKQRS